jgi:voltage-dependent anion channel protein 2
LLTQQLVITNAVLEGLKLDVTGTLQPNGANSTKASVELNQGGCIVTSATIDIFKGPVMVTDLATRFRDLQFGGELGYDVAKGTIDKYSVSIALDRAREKAVLQALTGFKTFTASYFQKFNDQLEVAYRASWNAKVPNLTMEVGAKWNMIGGGFLKAKLDNVGRLGLALASDLRPGVQVTLGATVDTAKLNENAHKLGLELIYSA